MLKAEKLKVVIFDWDGTIADNEKPRIDAINKVLKELDMPEWDIVKHRGNKNISFQDNFHHIFGNLADEAYHKYRNLYMQNMKNESKLFDGVIEALDFLKKHNIKIGVMTNKDRKIFDMEMPMLIDYQYFDASVCGGEAPNDKPSPDHALYILKDLIDKKDIKPETVWVVGDSIIDNQCAAAANTLPLRVNYGNDEDFERLQGAEVYYYATFRDFTDELVKSKS